MKAAKTPISKTGNGTKPPTVAVNKTDTKAEFLTPADIAKEMKDVPPSFIRKVLRSKIAHEKGKGWQIPVADKSKIVAMIREAKT